MPILGSQLELDRCPHCSVDRPTLSRVGVSDTRNYKNENQRHWGFYACARCGGVVSAAAAGENHPVSEIYPPAFDIHADIPARARSYLKQAVNSLHSPAGAVMLAASAVNAMLKAKDYKSGSLYSRIDQAARDHLITKGMAEWAHQVRLDANEQRHADEEGPEPDEADAKRCIEFGLALGQFLFVLPSQVEKGLKEAKEAKGEQ